MRFRQSLRNNKEQAEAYMFKCDPEFSGSYPGKTLNGFYEAVYHDIPNMIIPGIIMLSGATILLLKKPKKPNQHMDFTVKTPVD
jgi:hypothetical protein